MHSRGDRSLYLEPGVDRYLMYWQLGTGRSGILKPCLGGGFKHFLFSPRSLGKWSNLTCAYFSNGLVQPPSMILLMVQTFGENQLQQ